MVKLAMTDNTCSTGAMSTPFAIAGAPLLHMVDKPNHFFVTAFKQNPGASKGMHSPHHMQYQLHHQHVGWNGHAGTTGHCKCTVCDS